MRRITPIVLVLMLALLAGPAQGAGPSPGEIERLTLELERLAGPLIGDVDARNVIVTDLGRGRYALSYPLRGLPDGSFKARRTDDKPLRTLACGHMTTEPTTPASVITSVVSNIDVNYTFWWAVVNQGEKDMERRTSVKVSGPEEFEIEVADDVPYIANAVTLVPFNPEIPFPTSGLYLHRVVVKGAGKVFYRFWVDPLSTIEVER